MKKKTFDQIKKLVNNIEVNEQNEAIFIITARQNQGEPDIMMALYGEKDILAPCLAVALHVRPVVKAVFTNALASLANFEAEQVKKSIEKYTLYTTDSNKNSDKT